MKEPVEVKSIQAVCLAKIDYQMGLLLSKVHCKPKELKMKPQLKEEAKPLVVIVNTQLTNVVVKAPNWKRI